MARLQIVVLDDYPHAMQGSPAETKLRELGHVTIYDSLPTSEAMVIERIRDADVVVGIRGGNYQPFYGHLYTSNVISECRRLMHIAIWGVGVNHVDMEACKRRGIRVTNTPNTSSEAVAELSLTLALAVAHRITENDNLVKVGNWDHARHHMPIQLEGKTLGVLGAGPIAQQLIKIGKGVGMNVIAWTFHPSNERARSLGIKFVNLKELMSKADVVVILLPLSPETRGMIGKPELSLMKPSAILVNTGRGAVVDEDALIETLQSRRIYGAGLDVFLHEPLPDNHPLTKLQNVVLSPHRGGASIEANVKGLMMTAENIKDWLDGKSTNMIV